ncbi:hypothetical protein M438DRAFT_409157 [Aureobasidium pullulans EXF-150]|uniref:Uncharacterized protein n=1 Tax=Aureobasidium pullulans EXF-150 TaxID=1043002 RepID=A0A074X375_AURPU|nr:uncharacterized protein M438DRAFT_409157 [Aureobasidium pullulans EXF-150]KEQ79848.1 hypothetical protein M438DRAFT_409157 [Aureobasidium pullulans EXF-150]THY99624.1 hypothetical protein D6C92_02236 [Aureobasidium pullulans]
MADQWNTAKDMLVLLAVVRISEIDVNLDVAERIVAGWPAAMGEVPADAEGILRRFNGIWQKTVSSVTPSTPATLPTPATVKKELDGSCSAEPIVIDDDDDDDEDEADTQTRPSPTCDSFPLPCKPGAQTAVCTTPRKANKPASDNKDETETPETPDTPVLSRPLPRTFRVPPGLDLVTPRSSNKKSATTPKRVKVVVSFGKDDGEKAPTNSGPNSSQLRPNATRKHDTVLPTPESVEKHTTSETSGTRMPRNKKIKTLRISTTRKALDSHDEPKEDESSFETPATLATTRKRRHGLDYTASPTDYCYDNADDDDYEFEDVEGDDRLEAIFESSCPVVTPSKPPKKG